METKTQINQGHKNNFQACDLIFISPPRSPFPKQLFLISAKYFIIFYYSRFPPSYIFFYLQSKIGHCSRLTLSSVVPAPLSFLFLGFPFFLISHIHYCFYYIFQSTKLTLFTLSEYVSLPQLFILSLTKIFTFPSSTFPLPQLVLLL